MLGGMVKDQGGNTRDIWAEFDQLFALFEAILATLSQAPTHRTFTRIKIAHSPDAVFRFNPVRAGQTWEVSALAVTGVAGEKVRFYQNEAAPGYLLAKAILDADGEGVISTDVPIPLGTGQTLIITSDTGGETTVGITVKVTQSNDPHPIPTVTTGEQ